METTVITCPNCGANTTNHKNCEYCGSLFVRFQDLGMTYDSHKYEEQIIGLKEALKDNLAAQESTNGQNYVSTFIRNEELGDIIQIMSPKVTHQMVYYNLDCDSGNVELHTQPTIQSTDSQPSLLLCFRFVEFPGSFTRFDSAAAAENEMNANLHQRFKTMAEFPLFKYVREDLYTTANLKNSINHSYYIDFGQDYEGAAAIVSQYIKHVYGIYDLRSLDMNYDLEIQTEEEYQAVIEEQKQSGAGALWLGVLFFAACAISGFFIGGFFGILIMIGSIAMVVIAIVKALQS